MESNSIKIDYNDIIYSKEYHFKETSAKEYTEKLINVPIVIDIGSCFIRAGYAIDLYPRIICRSTIYTSKKKKIKKSKVILVIYVKILIQIYYMKKHHILIH